MMDDSSTPYPGPAFEALFTNPYAGVYYNGQFKTLVLRATESYIPIDEFKQTFEHIGQIAQQREVKSLVFDKQQLTTFDQPSMEWYFAIWKPAAKQYGIVNHFKLLPELEWFRQSVKAGQALIYQKFGTGFLAGVNISYVPTMQDALDACGKV